ncbi:MAG: zf-HC2 domain-containing protein [Planctomycetes bacterium]|nr:zf-HC2 domain-containing protein [Planctomycetota bacterium]
MQCHEVERLLPLLSSDALPAAARGEVEAHLDNCPSCAALAFPAADAAGGAAACTAIQTLLPLHAGNDLAADQERAVAHHLAGCNACAARSDSYRSALAGLADLARESRPDLFWRTLADRIMDRVAREAEAAGRAPAIPLAPAHAAAPALAPHAVAPPAGRLLVLARFGRRAAAVAAIFVVGIALGFLVMKARSAALPGGAGGGSEFARLPQAGPATEPSLGLGAGSDPDAHSLRPLFPRLSAPVTAASTAARVPRTFGLRDLRVGLVGAPTSAGLEMIAPFHAPDQAFSLDEIRPLADEELSAGY